MTHSGLTTGWRKRHAVSETKRNERLSTYDAELERLLILDAGSSRRVRRASRAGSDKVSRVDLNFVVEPRLHRAERRLGFGEEVLGLDMAKADRDTRRVGDGMGASLDYRRREGPSRGFEHEVEGVVRVEGEARELSRGVVQGIGDGGEALAIAPDGETEKFGLGELKLVPLEGYLSSTASVVGAPLIRSTAELTLV